MDKHSLSVYVYRFIFFAVVTAICIPIIAGVISGMFPNLQKSTEQLPDSLRIIRENNYSREDGDNEYYRIDGIYSVIERGFWFYRTKDHEVVGAVWPNGDEISLDCDQKEPDEYGYKLCWSDEENFYVKPDKPWSKWEP